MYDSQKGREDLSILNNVPFIVDAVMGRAHKTVKDVLALGEGSVLELDRDAQAPIDLTVNGRLIARGEVIEVDGYYGVRIIEVLG